jgi:glycosyltransferase involved in cell wall biosynthesis
MKTEWNNKKTILIFADWYLPGYKAGGPIKSISSIVNLLKNEFNFLIITTNTDFGESAPYDKIEANKWLKISDHVSVFYASKNYLTISSFFKLIKIIHFDVVYLNSFFSFYFSILPLLFYKMKLIKTPVLLAPRGMLGEGALGLKSRKKKIFISITKYILLHKNIYWQATSEQEKKEIEYVFGENIKIAIVPNMQYNNSSLFYNVPFKEKGIVKLFYLSRISPKKNLLFALQLLTKIKSNIGNVEYYIIGPIEDLLYWEKCKELIKKLPAHVHVFYEGTVVNAAVAEKIATFHFLFLPTLNENYGHAIVESFINGKPVIISDQTPWNELNLYSAGWDIALNNSDDFIRIIEACLSMDNATYLKCSAAAINYAKEKCLNEASIDLTKRMFINTFVL